MTGEILRSGFCSQADFLLEKDVGEFIVEEASDTYKQYTLDINTPVVTNKSANPAIEDTLTVIADGVSTVTFLNVSSGSRIRVSGQGVNINEAISGSETLTFDLLGDCAVNISGFPCLDYQVTIDAA